MSYVTSLTVPSVSERVTRARAEAFARKPENVNENPYWTLTTKLHYVLQVHTVEPLPTGHEGYLWWRVQGGVEGFSVWRTGWCRTPAEAFKRIKLCIKL